MTRHFYKPLSYAPKIIPCLRGEISQTIRGGQAVDSGDIITFFGWKDVAYRSPWSWRMEVYVVDAMPLEVFEHGICFGFGPNLLGWDSPAVCNMARRDGIRREAPTETLGQRLKRVLSAMLKGSRKGPRVLSDKPVLMQEIRWDPDTRKVDLGNCKATYNEQYELIGVI